MNPDGERYLIEVTSDESARYQHQWRGRAKYDYHPRTGILAFRVDGADHDWVRCSGRLTFEDLEFLVRRLPQPPVSSRMPMEVESPPPLVDLEVANNLQ